MTGGFDAAAARGGRGYVDVLADVPSAVERHLAALRELGIVISPPQGEIEIDFAAKRLKIGHLIADGGGVELVARVGVTLHQFRALILQAQVAVVEGPDPTAGWRRVDDVGWCVAIYEPFT
ncbi:hypothetical protein [Nocardia sp. NPDC004260]